MRTDTRVAGVLGPFTRWYRAWQYSRARAKLPQCMLLLIVCGVMAALLRWQLRPLDPPELAGQPLSHVDDATAVRADSSSRSKLPRRLSPASAAGAPPALSPALRASSSSSLSSDAVLNVAFAIPVGGRTKRFRQLREIISNLLEGGVPPANIFVVEDVLGRPGATPDTDVGEVVSSLGVHRIFSHVSRSDMPENGGNFGIHLARHYNFMLDYLLVSPAEARGTSVEDLVKKGAFDPARNAPAGPPFKYAVLIEDDLVLAPDFAKFFVSMSKVMEVDPSVYCVSAHQDNAFLGTSFEQSASDLTPLDPMAFAFRRGNHFMAPGWMTSAEIYRKVVRENWLTPEGEYKRKDSLHLRNGHWDRFFDSLIASSSERDCIFPESPRIIHEGADGFTVDQRAQMELYSNLRLSRLDPRVEYGDLSRMTKEGYIASQLEFISQAKRLASLEESRLYRHASLVFLLEHVGSDKDEGWNSILNGFFGLIGVGGYGGWEGYVKVRGIHRGAVFVRWTTNVIMLVGAYSPYAERVREKQSDQALDLVHEGCFRDTHSPRDLPVLLSHYSFPSILSPALCLSACAHGGYKYAGLQAGMECWCGSSMGRHGKGDKCDMTCAGGACGGAWQNSIYSQRVASGGGDAEALVPSTSTVTSATPLIHEASMRAPADAVYVVGGAGESCTEACAAESARSGEPLRCSESLFPLLHRHCPLLRSLLHCSPDLPCREEEDMTLGVATPGGVAGGVCTFSKGRYIRCHAKPALAADAAFRRACVCEKVPDAT